MLADFKYVRSDFVDINTMKEDEKRYGLVDEDHPFSSKGN